MLKEKKGEAMIVSFLLCFALCKEKVWGGPDDITVHIHDKNIQVIRRRKYQYQQNFFFPVFKKKDQNK